MELKLIQELKLKDSKEELAREMAPIRLSASAPTEVVASRYMRRDEHYRSVIIFKADTHDCVGSSTVVMPNAVADFEEITSLISAVRNVVRYDFIIIDDLISNKSCMPGQKRWVPITKLNISEDMDV